MSKTDKTRPWWVRVSEHPGRTCVEWHDHCDGVCDLPDLPGRPGGPSGDPTNCTWEPSALTYFGPGGGCGCRTCARTRAGEGRKLRRAERARGRQLCRDALSQVGSGRQDG